MKSWFLGAIFHFLTSKTFLYEVLEHYEHPLKCTAYTLTKDNRVIHEYGCNSSVISSCYLQLTLPFLNLLVNKICAGVFVFEFCTFAKCHVTTPGRGHPYDFSHIWAK